MAQTPETRGRGGRDEVEAWYLGRLRPRMAEAVTSGTVARERAADLDRQVRQLLELPAGAPAEIPWAA